MKYADTLQEYAMNYANNIQKNAEYAHIPFCFKFSKQNLQQEENMQKTQRNLQNTKKNMQSIRRIRLKNTEHPFGIL